MDRPIHRVIDLVDPASQDLHDQTPEEARAWMVRMARERADGDETSSDTGTDADAPQGSYALVARDGERVLLARSLDRPLRTFLAKEASGPLLVVAERMDEIRAHLESLGYGGQFHPTYTRMVPAHHVLSMRLIGCPDPNPRYLRWFAPERATGPTDLDTLGARYVGAVRSEIEHWLDRVAPDAPLGVAFSGGVDSGTVLLTLYRTLLDRGESPARLKAFTLAVDGGGADLAQAREFVRRLDLEVLLEEIPVSSDEIDPFEAVELIEDYKPLDVECAAMTLALARGIRRRYPDWVHLVDGDGGDENLKSYPIEENPELTIRSVVNNSMLYQEGWGVDAIKHSLTYSGGLSRSAVRTWAPARSLGFQGFSPCTRPAVIEAAEAIPFGALTEGSHEALYALKGDLLARGVKAVTGLDLPVFPKRRFQHGAGDRSWFDARFDIPPARYREHLLDHLAGGAR